MKHGSIDSWQDFLAEDVSDPVDEALNFRDWWFRQEAEKESQKKKARKPMAELTEADFDALLAHLEYQATFWGIGSRPGCDYARWAEGLQALRDERAKEADNCQKDEV